MQKQKSSKNFKWILRAIARSHDKVWYRFALRADFVFFKFFGLPRRAKGSSRNDEMVWIALGKALAMANPYRKIRV